MLPAVEPLLRHFTLRGDATLGDVGVLTLSERVDRALMLLGNASEGRGIRLIQLETCVASCWVFVLRL